MSLVLALLLALAPQKPAAPALKPLPVVTVNALQALMPDVGDWTRAPLTGDVVRVSDDSGYSFAVADFTKDTAKMHLTIGDTVGVGDCLMALAGMISVLPEGYSEKPEPSTAILRFTYEGFQAASKWNATKFSGEFSVLVADRFVVKAEGEGIPSLDSLRELAAKVDFKKLAALATAK